MTTEKTQAHGQKVASDDGAKQVVDSLDVFSRTAQKVKEPVNIALFQPDMATNAAAAIRLAACLGLPVDIVEPSGFVWDERRMKRVGMDYLDRVDLHRWPSFETFDEARRREGRRLVLLTTQAAAPYHEVGFRPDDILMGGRESAGAPEEVHAAADLRVAVPMAGGARSLNLVTALAMVVGEALRQTEGFSGQTDGFPGARR